MKRILQYIGIPICIILTMHHIGAIKIDKRVVVIGGGAAGYFAGIECARQLHISTGEAINNVKSYPLT